MEDIRFACPKCAKSIKVASSFAGGQGKCPGCGERVEVPSHKPAAVDEIVDTFERPDPRLPPVPPPPPVARRPYELVEQSQSTHVPPVALQVNVSQSNNSGTSNSLGIASLVVGVLSLLTFCVPFVGLIIALLGLGLGIGGLTLAIIRRGRGIGFSIAGIVLSGIGLLFAIFVTFVMSVTAVAFDETAKEMEKEREQQRQGP